MDELNKCCVCPCRVYPNKVQKAKHRTWICLCDDIQVYKYCHYLLFVTEQGMPIAESLPEGRHAYSEVEAPTQDTRRPLTSMHRSEKMSDIIVRVRRVKV